MAVRFRAANGIELAADVEGPWRGPLVVLLHGGGQTRHAWGGTTRVLAAQGLLAVSLDLRGHGESDWAPDGDYAHRRASPPTCARWWPSWAGRRCSSARRSGASPR